MSDQKNSKTALRRLTDWVDGTREPRDRTLFVMEQRPHHETPAPAELERRERRHLRRFLARYPFSAVLVALVLVGILMAAVLDMPEFGRADNPANSEVAQHYLEYGEEETGAENAVTAMILSYRGFDTLGESCVLFLAVVCVMMLLLRDEKNTDDHDRRQQAREDAAEARHRDIILDRAARILIPLIFLFAAYVLLNGERSPGGGFAGGAILGSALVLYACAFGQTRLRRFMNRKTYSAVRTAGLLLYAGLYGVYIFEGANGLPNHLAGMNLLIDLAVGLVVACTVYGFYAMFSRGEL